MTSLALPKRSALDPAALVEDLPGEYPRLLLIGAPGSGKSTLAAALAEELAACGRACSCLSADPGSPAFGPPGAVALGVWGDRGWRLVALEALCSLDAGRFRLPLVAAVARLAAEASAGTLLLDAPGVVRGVAAAELLAGIAAAAGMDRVLVLRRGGEPALLAAELRALAVPVTEIAASPGARRPGRRLRERRRTLLWDAYLAEAELRTLNLDATPVLGTPPPLQAAEAWAGRQIAVLDGPRTLAMGEIKALAGSRLQLSLPRGTPPGDSLLVRDAQRLAAGWLGSARPFRSDRLEYLPPPDLAPREPAGHTAGGPRPIGRVGALEICLVNGVFGDPLLHARLRHQGRSLLFDLGDGARLPARVAHQVSDVFISHCHVDHIAGFLWLLRSRIGDYPTCRLYGPPGLAENIDGLTRGILWDRAGAQAPRFAIAELHGDRLLHFSVQAGHALRRDGEARVADGQLLADTGFRVRAVSLQHSSPVLAFAFEPAPQLNVRKDRLARRRLAPGPWLGELKRRVRARDWQAMIGLPDGAAEPCARLADELLLSQPGKRLVYATDFADNPVNRQRLIALARGAHTLFCEASFLAADAEQAKRTDHLTTTACGQIAAAAGVARLVPFHFSRRYAADPSNLYREIAAECPAVATPPGLVLA